MQYGSLFSGIGGFDLALECAGFTCAWQCEIDKRCQDVLRRHFNTRIYDDVRSINRNNAEPVDLICGGFPCQDLSIAGKRAGLAGERSGLWFEFARIIEEFSPGWVLIENVPGLLSSNGGRDFAVILNQLVEFGYGVVWRVLDAQYFGVAQRRRRVFIVGSLGSGRAAEVLFEHESGPGDTPPSREKGERVAAIAVRQSETGSNGWGVSEELFGTLDGSNSWTVVDGRNLIEQENISSTLQSKKSGGYSLNYQPIISFSAGQSADAYGLAMDENVTPPIRAGESGTNRVPTIAWHNKQQSGEIRIQGETVNAVTQQWGTGENNVPFIGVRRLTPTECERLQGFPDDWTAGQSDSARYRQLGNAVAVPVVEWIARRIADAR